MRLRSGNHAAGPPWTIQEGTLPHLIAPDFLEETDLSVEEREELAARIIDWDAVVVRAQSHPHEAECCSERCNPLHVMWFHDPPCRAIKAVFDAFPAAIDSFSASGLPLHIVLSHYDHNDLTAEVSRLILRLHME
jgi:hypothetical protein